MNHIRQSNLRLLRITLRPRAEELGARPFQIRWERALRQALREGRMGHILSLLKQKTMRRSTRRGPRPLLHFWADASGAMARRSQLHDRVEERTVLRGGRSSATEMRRLVAQRSHCNLLTGAYLRAELEGGRFPPTEPNGTNSTAKFKVE